MSLSVPDFSSVDVIVAGDAMLDEYWFGDAARISPEAPVPVVHTSTREQRAGGAANVAVNLAALGARVKFYGAAGEDDSAASLADILSGFGVETRLASRPDLPTIRKLRVLARNQQLIRLDDEHDFASLATDVNAAVVAGAGPGQVVVLSDYGKGTLDRVAELIERLRARNCRVFVDPKGTDFERYRGCFCLTPNQSEFAAVVGAWTDEREFVNKARQLRKDLALEYLLVTRSERGMMLIGDGSEPVSLSAEAREVFDVTGAGDTVIATLAASVGVGLPLPEAVALANLAASLAVAKIGAAQVTPAELKAALHRRGFGGRGLVPAEDLKLILAEARGRGDRVVMTNGCFDILHAGHVSYLEEAKSLGDQLVVAVNDDASVVRLKGPERPITPLEDRMAVLAGLAAVDWVVPFSDDTPQSLIELLEPDILVKGGDWRVDQIAGADSVLARGGDVKVLPFKQGRSTTGVIDRIRSRASD